MQCNSAQPKHLTRNTGSLCLCFYNESAAQELETYGVLCDSSTNTVRSSAKLAPGASAPAETKKKKRKHALNIICPTRHNVAFDSHCELSYCHYRWRLKYVCLDSPGNVWTFTWEGRNNSVLKGGGYFAKAWNIYFRTAAKQTNCSTFHKSTKIGTYVD